jgi:hypothetical protein
MTHSVDFTGVEDLEGEELKATLEHLNTALANQQKLVREVASVKRQNRILTWIVGLLVVILVVASAAVATSVRASTEARDATAEVRAASLDVVLLREEFFIESCEDYNERRDFDEQVLYNDAFPPERERTTIEDIPNLDQLSPDLRDVLIFLDGEGDKTEEQERERLAVKVQDLEEFREKFPRRDCQALSASRLERINNTIQEAESETGSTAE